MLLGDACVFHAASVKMVRLSLLGGRRSVGSRSVVWVVVVVGSCRELS